MGLGTIAAESRTKGATHITSENDALTVYVDDSGSDSKSKVAAAAFCVSTVERWHKLLKKWRKIASDAGFDLKDFHMTEFVACRRGEPCQQCQHCKAVNHPWKTWSDNKRKSVLIRMAKAIVENVEFGVGHAYTKADYDEHVLQSPARSVANEPIGEEYFTFAVQRCGGSLAEWRAAKSRMVPLKFVFDTASKSEKKEIAKVFFGEPTIRRNTKTGSSSGLIQKRECLTKAEAGPPITNGRYACMDCSDNACAGDVCI